MNWVCDIPGASTVVSTLHFALHVGLAAAVVIGGVVFLALGVHAYRTPAVAEVEAAGSGRQSGTGAGVTGVQA
jgi:hypothetical protein